MIKTVIFDFDGTIADTLPLIIEFFNQNAEKFGFKKLGSSEVEGLRNKTVLEIIKEYKISLFRLAFIAKKLRDDLGKKIRDAKLIPEIKEVFFKLKKKGFKIGILSSNSKENIEKFLLAKDLKMFDFIQSETNIFGKDRALRNLLRRYNLPRENVIYVGDEVRDIEACKKNRVKIIAVTWGFSKKEIWKKNKPDYLVNKPQEILKIVSV